MSEAADQQEQAARKEEARTGIQEAIRKSRKFDMEAAIEEGENAGLPDDELKQCRDLLKEQQSEDRARDLLEQALVDHEPSCLRSVGDGICCSPSTDKMDALTTALAAAEDAGLEAEATSEAKQVLALEMLYHAQLIPLKNGARHKYEEIRKAVEYADECDAEELPILRAKVVMEEAHTQWKLEAKAALQRAVDDEDIPPTLYDKVCTGLTCGYGEKGTGPPAFHKLRALKLALSEGEDAGLNDDELEEARLELDDVQGDVSTRMNILEDKMFQLEAQLVLQAEQPGFCCKIVGCIFDICRTIPLLSILSFVLAVSGFAVILEHTEGFKSAVDTLTLSNYLELGINYSSYFLIFYVVVDTMALIVAFPASGTFRERMFGRKNIGSLEVLECIFGPCTVGLILVAIIAGFLLVLGVLCALLPYVTVLFFGSVACAVSPPKTDSLVSALTTTGYFQKEVIAVSLSNLCKQDYWTLYHNTMMFVLGVGIVVVSQAWTQCLTASNLQKIWMQPKAVEIPEWARQEYERKEVLKLTSIY